jgi:hypothetical protein
MSRQNSEHFKAKMDDTYKVATIVLYRGNILNA